MKQEDAADLFRKRSVLSFQCLQVGKNSKNASCAKRCMQSVGFEFQKSRVQDCSTSMWWDESSVLGAKPNVEIVHIWFLAFCYTICMRRDKHCTSSQKKKSSSSLPTKACIVERNSKSQLSPISHLHCDNLCVVMLSSFHLVKCYILTCHIHLREFCDKRNALCSKYALSKILQY